MADLDTLYFPNKWVKRYPSDIVVKKHLEFTSTHSSLSRQKIPNELNIPYGSLEKEKYDILGTDLDDNAPIFAFIHGGYWQKEYLGRDTYHFIADNLYKNGIKSIFIGYELCPRVMLEEIVKEVEIASKKCIAYAKKHKSKGLYLAGYSSGAHLLLSLFKNISGENIIKGIVLICGIYDLIEIPKTSVNSPLKLTRESALELSPLRQAIPRINCAVYVVAAEHDSPIFKDQAEKLNEKLSDAQIDSKFLILEETDHFTAVEFMLDEHFQLTKIVLNMITGNK